MKLKLLYDRRQIADRVLEMGELIDKTYGQEPLVAICVLKGAAIFFADLGRSIKNPALELDFIQLASYGSADVSSGHVTFKKDLEADINDKHVLVVEDIVDSGMTMAFLQERLLARKPRSLRIAAMIDKKSRRETGPEVDFSGFVRGDGFLVGYGMDYAEKYRSLPDIYEIID